MLDNIPQEERRRNHVHAAFVNAAINIQELVSTERAVALLLREGLPSEVICRVLRRSRPGQIRGLRKAPQAPFPYPSCK